MANKFKIWVDDAYIDNVLDYASFSSNEDRGRGFRPSRVAISKNVNSALRQANLVAAALMNVIAPDSERDLTSSLDDVIDDISNSFPFNLNLRNGTGSQSLTQGLGLATGTNSFSNGSDATNVANGAFSYARGYYNTANGTATTVIGTRNTNGGAGSFSFILGQDQKSNFPYSFVLGVASSSTSLDRNTAGSHAFVHGVDCYAGQYSFAKGYKCSMPGSYSFGLGATINTTGNNLFAHGSNISITSSFNCYAFGDNISMTNKNYCYSFGQGLTSTIDYQTLFGKFADSTGVLFAIGNGTSSVNKKNVVSVTTDGRMKVSGAPTEDDDVVRKGDFGSYYLCTIVVPINTVYLSFQIITTSTSRLSLSDVIDYIRDEIGTTDTTSTLFSHAKLYPCSGLADTYVPAVGLFISNDTHGINLNVVYTSSTGAGQFYITSTEFNASSQSFRKCGIKL